MRFGPVPLAEAEGALLAHAVAVGGKSFRKAHCLTAEDVAFMREAGVAEVVAAVLSSEDIDEDAAATRIVAAMRFDGIEAKPASTGRVNLYARQAGLFAVDKALVDRLNVLDPSITLATIAAYKPVGRGDMVATVKIIPFAVDRRLIDQATSLLSLSDIFAVHPFRSVSVGLIQTVLPGLKESVLAKTTRITSARLARSGSVIGEERRVAHSTLPLAEAMTTFSATNDMVIVFGASALCDFDDVIPSAIRRAGGEVLRAGMPVDPGNLLVLGRLNGKPVIGAPGCARSPKENGFDWVLDRLIAGLDVTEDDIAGMGVGGLLMEIPTRPQPREASVAARPVDVHAVILAAGRSSRMRGPNKLMALFSGRPLIRQTAERALASLVQGAVVVIGHQAERVRDTLDGLDVDIVHNPDFESGLSSSLKAGVAALPPSSGALILLGDMPEVSVADMDRLVTAFRKAGGQAIVRATHDGKRGNPVILPRALFGQVSTTEGDTGARHLVESGLAEVIDVEIGAGASIDVDTQDALESAGGVLQD
ncbi:molybdopterin-binding/glycosyltransferase family 2 protein [Mesorhizobium sp. VNQ89]|uniref:molybdopterin-binding/glycosyltransferase family 2 protein n=1 Tax=Mesorhizobium quangtriensis TaxID=3157709 RepID=UPI0032B745BE